MKRRGLVIILASAMSFPVAAAEKQSEQSLGRQQQTYTPSLAVVMGVIQLSHFKLWLAGNLRNWPLAEYELSQMNATLQDARALFPNMSAADTSAMSAEELRDAIRTKGNDIDPLSVHVRARVMGSYSESEKASQHREMPSNAVAALLLSGRDRPSF